MVPDRALGSTIHNWWKLLYSAPYCSGLVCYFQNNELVQYRGPQRLENILQHITKIIIYNNSLPQLETRYSCKVVKDLMNCFALDLNKLQLKASLDNNKQFSCKLERSN
jgi:glycogen synthase